MSMNDDMRESESDLLAIQGFLRAKVKECRLLRVYIQKKVAELESFELRLNHQQDLRDYWHQQFIKEYDQNIELKKTIERLENTLTHYQDEADGE